MTENHRDDIVEIRLPSNTKHLHAVRTLTRNLAESMGFATHDSEETALAVEEAVSNVIEHAYHGEQDHQMRVIFRMNDRKFTVRILHNGDQLDLARIPAENLSEFYLQKKRGGLGILIMKKFMDEVSYKSGPRQKECCMVKYLKD